MVTIVVVMGSDESLLLSSFVPGKNIEKILASTFGILSSIATFLIKQISRKINDRNIFFREFLPKEGEGDGGGVADDAAVVELDSRWDSLPWK